MMLNEWFYYLIDLHYSQTHRLQDTEREKFYYLIDLHYSQTWWYTKRELNKFYYLIDLHYSQTTKGIHTIAECFTTLQIYTILKHIVNSFDDIECFTTLQIYTILKQLLIHFFQSVRFTTLQIYTILKHNIRLLMCLRVLLPYRFTLFSNRLILSEETAYVLLPYRFTLFSNLSR